jgi:hypothetical protein
MGHGLVAQRRRGGGLRRAKTGHTLWALTVRSPCGACARAGAVTRSMVARWGLACSKVLSASTGGVPGWRWAGGVEAGLTLAVAHLAGAERGVGAGAVVGVGGEGAPMSGGAVDGR